MLCELEPFKTNFQLLQFAGFWRTEEHSTVRKIISFVIFLWLHPVGIVFLSLSILYVEDVGESARVIFFGCITTFSFGYDGNFVIVANKFESLIVDIDAIAHEHPQVRKNLIKLCVRMKKEKIGKMTVLFICVILGTCLPLFTRKLPSPIFTPDAMKNSTEYFYFSWVFETAAMVYLGTFTTASQDLFVDFLLVINAYNEVFQMKLKSADLSGSHGRVELIECINLHRNIKK